MTLCSHRFTVLTLMRADLQFHRWFMKVEFVRPYYMNSLELQPLLGVLAWLVSEEVSHVMSRH